MCKQTSLHPPDRRALRGCALRCGVALFSLNTVSTSAGLAGIAAAWRFHGARLALQHGYMWRACAYFTALRAALLVLWRCASRTGVCRGCRRPLPHGAGVVVIC